MLIIKQWEKWEICTSPDHRNFTSPGLSRLVLNSNPVYEPPIYVFMVSITLNNLKHILKFECKVKVVSEFVKNKLYLNKAKLWFS